MREGGRRIIGFLAYTAIVLLLFCLLPHQAFDPHSDLFLLGIGVIAIWRYLWMGAHYLRAYCYINMTFPLWRKQLESIEKKEPEKLYILATFFRIGTVAAARSVHSILAEAQYVSCETMIILSVVEAQDEEMALHIISQYDLPSTLKIHIIKAQGKGKRHGLAQALRVVSHDMPEDSALCIIMDGDTVIPRGITMKCAGFFQSMPRLGACTTDELGIVENTVWMQDWYDLRFAQRHILMSSIALSKRVMTLTGRMSMFRASVVAEQGFIDCIEKDHLSHWRLGHIPMLTGDDKSSLYYLLKEGYEQIYIPDVQTVSMEAPPSSHFIKSTSMLMQRWFGNMLRTNGRVLKLGLSRLPFFVWWSFLDQRLSMWTTFCGPVFAFMLSFRYGIVFLLYYLAWIAFVRGLQSLTLFMARPHISWRYPILLYYNQIYGAFLKIYAVFNLHRQSWTRQKIGSQSEGILSQWNSASSALMHTASLLFMVTAIGFAGSLLILPENLRHLLIYWLSSKN